MKKKNKINIGKHNVSFYEAQRAFLDIKRIILQDVDHKYYRKKIF
ncbi:hypothetical protein MCC_04890 [Rickettsia rhipicephali str. 3-7-female6-CWPP]|uniref:Uncharacterized protein n=1 Tax=Rickettsia rhipicephali (strain 3-7-female6-CWPP) TaxID=1105113 RepID=A0AAI8AA25_RICR3|nr:hypothetical protein MCC_04890 [Rickettsia rhipicephali str. 3-7-female6-CWPP]